MLRASFGPFGALCQIVIGQVMITGVCACVCGVGVEHVAIVNIYLHCVVDFIV